MARWLLELLTGEGGQVERIPLKQFPVVVGRSDDADVTLDSTDVSRHHAELCETGLKLFVRDLGSTNGTCVNHQKISELTPIFRGDVLHFANVEARVIEYKEEPAAVSGATLIMQGELSNKIPLGARDLMSLLKQKQVVPVFQPIVAMNGQHVAYELLGRGAHPKLSPGPGPLFNIAESIGQAVQLSELFRDVGIQAASHSGLKLPLFINTHPHEMLNQERFLDCMRRARAQYPDMTFVVEIHEQAVTNIAAMQSLAEAIKALGCRIAYDDFGAGQARLLELTEAPPHIVKFDIALIRNIHLAGQQKQDMLEVLVSMVRKMGMQALAEGVECAEEAEVCARIGFDLIQGYAYGKPAPMVEWQPLW